MFDQLRLKLFNLIECRDPSKIKKVKFFNGFVIFTIVINILAFVLESVEPIRTRWIPFFDQLNFCFVVFYTLEYLLRVWVSAEAFEGKSNLSKRLRFIFSWPSLIDLLGFLPYYLLFLGMRLEFFPILRLFRIPRLSYYFNFYTKLDLFIRVFVAKRVEMAIVATITVLLILLSSTFIYFIEHDAQPEVFSSIPSCMWWSIVTLTTLGYGDAVPLTSMGKVLGAVTAIFGIGLIALPTGILGAGYSRELRIQSEELDRLCQNCKTELSKDP